MSKQVKRNVTIYINGKEVKNQIKSIAGEYKRAQNEIALMTRGTEDYEKKMKEINHLNGILRDHNQKIRGIGKTWKKNGDGLKQFAGVAAGAFVTDRIIQYGNELYNTAIEMDTLSRKANIVFGESLPAVDAAAEKNAENMGLTTSEYVNAATAIGDILIPMKFQRDEAALISTELVDLSGALSEWTGGQRSSEEVTKILGKALVGEREQLKELGIVIQEADVKARLAEKGLKGLTGEMLQQAKAAATLELITEKSLDAQTAYAENTDSMVRKQAQLIAKISDVKEKLALALIPVFNRLVDVVGGAATVIQNITDFFGKLTDEAGYATTGFNEQKVAVEQLEGTLNPLLTRYDELKSKSKLSKKEQKELKQVISDISIIVPTAATGFDKYGNALDINRGKVLEFIDAQKLLLRQKNEEAINKNTDALESYRRKIEDIQKALSTRDDQGNLVKVITRTFKSADGPMEVFHSNVKLTGEEIQRLRDQLKKLQKDAGDTENAVKILSGELAPPEPSSTGSSGSGGGGSDCDPACQAAKAKAKARAEAEEEARQKEEAAAEKARQKAIEEEEKQKQRILDMIKKHENEILLSKMAEAEREEEVIRQKYEKEIALAEEMETKQIEGSTERRIELERLRDEEIQLAREEREKAANENYLEQKEAAEQEITEKIREQLLSERELELEELEEHYIDLMELAREYHVKTNGLVEAYNKEKDEIEKKYEQKEIDRQNKLIGNLNVLGGAFGDLAGAVGDAMDLAGEKGKDFVILQKLLKTAQVAMSMAASISYAIENAMVLPFPDNLLAVTSAIASVVGFFSQVHSLMDSAPVPQKRQGRWTNVRGEDDGRTYTAEMIGSPGTGMLPSHPVVLASEDGLPEYFVSNAALQNPLVLNHVQAIDDIVTSRVPQFKSGGYTDEPNVNIDMSAITSMIATNNLLMQQLLTVLSQPLIAAYDDEEVIRSKQTFNRLNKNAGGVLDS